MSKPTIPTGDKLSTATCRCSKFLSGIEDQEIEDLLYFFTVNIDFRSFQDELIGIRDRYVQAYLSVSKDHDHVTTFCRPDQMREDYLFLDSFIKI